MGPAGAALAAAIAIDGGAPSGDCMTGDQSDEKRQERAKVPHRAAASTVEASRAAFACCLAPVFAAVWVGVLRRAAHEHSRR